jgi:hypothetical protein
MVTNLEEVCDIPFLGFGTIELYRSLDGGTSWSDVIQPDESFITDPIDRDCGADGIVNQDSMPVVGPNGELYVAWERGWFAPAVGSAELPRATIAFAASTDQEATFSTPVEVASICSGALGEPAAYNRTSSNDFPRVALPRSGPDRGGSTSRTRTAARPLVRRRSARTPTSTARFSDGAALSRDIVRRSPGTSLFHVFHVTCSASGCRGLTGRSEHVASVPLREPRGRPVRSTWVFGRREFVNREGGRCDERLCFPW